MKQKILIKLIAMGCAIFGLLALNGLLVNTLVERQANVVTAFVASHDIAPRTKITENDIAEVKVAGVYVDSKTYLFKEDILGKYTDIQGKIPAGSPFYISMLVKEEEVPDFAALQLKEGQVSFLLEQPTEVLNTVATGERVDLSFSSTVVSGTLLRHARILALRDVNGYSIEKDESDGSAVKVELAISKDDYDFLIFASKNGKLNIYATSESYDENAEALLETDTYVYRYLKNLAEG